MASLKKIARRTFLIGSAAVVGGVAFGVYKLEQDPKNPLVSREGATALNPFVIINEDGVTLIAPRAEMGQGVHTTLPALIAEELDVAWQDIRVMHGPGAAAYYNGALLGKALPFLDYKVGPIKEDMRQFVGQAGKLLSLQVTGGSTSTADAYERFREAGATARETLKLAAAKRLGVDVSSLKTENGNVIAPDGTLLSYASLAVEAAQIEPPKVELRPASDWKYLGKSMPRTDMIGKSTGTATFGVDVRLEGMKFATVRMSPKRGKMLSFDASDAILMDGVEQIIDLGDGIAVIGSNTWLCIQAAEAVEIVWDDATHSQSTENAFAQIEAAFGTEADITRDEGNVEKAQDGIEVTAEYRVPYLAHATMEPLNATALYTGDALTIWCGNQGPVLVQRNAAAAVGLDASQVTVNTTLMGGGFGRRGETDFAVIAARVAREVPDVPVQVTWSREEDMRHDFYRPAAIGRYRGVVKDGAAVLLDGRVAAPSASQQAMKRWMGQDPVGPDKELGAGGFDQPYAIPNYRFGTHIADARLPVGFWRSVSASFNGFMFDSFMDEMAHAAGTDPLAFRLAAMGNEHEPSRKVLEKVGEMCGWTGQTPQGVGRGVAFTSSFETPVATVVEIVDQGGKIRLNKVWMACDVGVALDPSIIKAQLTGGAIFGLSAAIFGEITIAEGAVEQSNFYDYELLRMHTAPSFEVEILQNKPIVSGIGEPGTPPSIAALANAVFDLTGERPRELPLVKSFDFLA